MKSFDQQVRDWAASKPAEVHYNYMDNHSCALCHFLKEQGFEDDPEVGGMSWGKRDDMWAHPISDKLTGALSGSPWTFGGLVERLS